MIFYQDYIYAFYLWWWTIFSWERLNPFTHHHWLLILNFPFALHSNYYALPLLVAQPCSIFQYDPLHLCQIVVHSGFILHQTLITLYLMVTKNFFILRFQHLYSYSNHTINTIPHFKCSKSLIFVISMHLNMGKCALNIWIM